MNDEFDAIQLSPKKMKCLVHMRSLSNSFYNTRVQRHDGRSHHEQFINPIAIYVNLLLSIELGMKMCIIYRQQGEINFSDIKKFGHNMIRLFDKLDDEDRESLLNLCPQHRKIIRNEMEDRCDDFLVERYFFEKHKNNNSFKLRSASPAIREFAAAVNNYIYQLLPPCK